MASGFEDPIDSWSCVTVSAWLKEIGLEQYDEMFSENDISGEEMLELSHELLQELGVKSIGHRLKILNGIKKLQAARTAPPAVAAPAAVPASVAAPAAIPAVPVAVAPPPAVESAPTQPMGDHEGWLTKQGANVKSWKRRYFVLKDMILSYFKSPEDKEPINTIVIPSYAVEEGKIAGKKYHFQISHPNCRTYYFFADCEEERQGWMRAIREMGLATSDPAFTIRVQGAPPKDVKAQDGYDPTRPLMLDPVTPPSVAASSDTIPKFPDNLSAKSPVRSPVGVPARTAPPRPKTPPDDDEDGSRILQPGQGMLKPFAVSGAPSGTARIPPAKPPKPVLSPELQQSVQASSPRSAELTPPPSRPPVPMSKSPTPPRATSPLPAEPLPSAVPPPSLSAPPISDLGSGPRPPPREGIVAPGRGRAGRGRPMPRTGAAGSPRASGPPPRGGSGAPSPRGGGEGRAAGRGGRGAPRPASDGSGDKKLSSKDTVVMWMNAFLVNRNLSVVNPETDLCDGVLLINLLEILSSRSIGDYCKVCNSNEERLSNLRLAQNFMNELRVDVDWDVEDVLQGRMMPILKLCLGINAAITKARRASQR